MKRYVKEFAQDMMKEINGAELMKDEIKFEYTTKINRIVECNRLGLITDFEAINEICKILRKGD